VSDEGKGLVEDEDNKCKICFDKVIDTVILRCGHVAVCSQCGKGLKLCPMCRQPILELIKTFKS